MDRSTPVSSRSFLALLLSLVATAARGADNAAPAPARIVEVVPTSQRQPATWRYTFRQPGNDWARPAFNDGNWSRGPGGFGTPGTPGAVVRTTWATPDVWLRREVTLPATLPDPSTIRLVVFHDEDVEVYLDGVPAASRSGYVTEYEALDLAPSANIAVGYGTTVLTTKDRDVVDGIIKDATDDAITLMGADGQATRVPTADVAERRTSDVSMMPDGLETGLTNQEFADLVEYLVSLKFPETAAIARQGMPASIPESSKRVALVPFVEPAHRFDHPEGFEPYSARYRKPDARFVPPVFAYPRKFGNSITGGYVYRANPSSPFYGVYVCADYTSKRIWGLTHENRVMKSIRQIATAPEHVASFARDAAGNLYVVGYEGMIYKLDFTGVPFDDQPAPGAPAQPGK